MALLPPLGAKWGACSPCSAPTDSGTFPASLLESLGTWFQSLILDLGVGGDTETALGGGTDGPRAGRQWVADGTARRRFLQETALSLRGCLGVCVCVCWGWRGVPGGRSISPSHHHQPPRPRQGSENPAPTLGDATIQGLKPGRTPPIPRTGIRATRRVPHPAGFLIATPSPEIVPGAGAGAYGVGSDGLMRGS